MKGIRFYEELRNKGRKVEQSRGTVFAAYVCNGAFITADGSVAYEGLGALFDEPNSVTGSTAVTLDYLRRECRRIPEARAREIHPALFAQLDAKENA